MSGDTCNSCKFFGGDGCHLNPPVRLPRKFNEHATAGNRIRDEELIWGWPPVGPNDWCGQHQAG